MSDELITYADLVSDRQLARKEDAVSKLLSMPPHASWIKRRDDIKVKDDAGRMVALQYLPIDKVEFLLTKIFQRWRVEIIDFKVLAHSVGVHVRLHYKNPASGEWLYTDGVGAVALQFDSKSDKNEVNNMKSNAVQLALPAAKSYAVKDAAETLGAIFGKDLNRRDIILGFKGSYESPEPEPKKNTVDDNLPL
jgi:hypothetical protein